MMISLTNPIVFDFETAAIVSTPREELISLLRDRISANPLIRLHPTKVERSVDQMSITREDDALDGHEWFYDNERQEISENGTLLRQESLWEYLTNQIMCYRNTPLRAIMLALVEEINEDGYLKIDADEICAKLQCTLVELEDAVTLIQQLEPTGIGARSLQECWLLQTMQDSAAPLYAQEILMKHFDLLVARRLDELANLLGTSTAELIDVLHYYQRLSAKPGAVFQQQSARYITPDVFLQAQETGWEVLYNHQGLPVIQFNAHYDETLRQSADETLTQYLDGAKQSYQRLQEALQLRKALVVQLTQLLVAEQSAFIEGKGGRKRVLDSEALAEHLGLSMEAYDAVIADKYVRTDFGVFALKDLLK